MSQAPAGIPEVRFDERAMFAEASRRAGGLDDFGDDSFREAFRLLIAGLDGEAKLTPIGRVSEWERSVGLLVNRLRQQDHVKRHPEILAEEIRSPVFIVGFPRTGTTMLHRLLASAPGMNAVYWWECRHPSPFPGTRWGEPDPRIAAAKEEVRQILAARPELAAIHPWDAEGPDEEIMLLENSFLSWTPESMHDLPSFGAWRERQDLTPAYTYLRQQLQFLQWQKRQAGRCGDLWVLKAPFHLGYVEELFAAFPDARIVQTHRDPVQSVPSFASMTVALWSLGSDDVDPQVAGQRWAKKFHDSLYSCMAARDRRWNERFLDVWYKDVATDPLGQVRRIYAFLGRELAAEMKGAMQRWVETNPREGRPPHEYTLDQFGFTRAGIEEYFAEYRRRFVAGRS